MPTMATVRAHARRLGLEVESYTAGRYHNINVDCPAGKQLDPGLHHFHASWNLCDSAEKKAAIADLCSRLESLTVLDDCEDPECDWCQP